MTIALQSSLVYGPIASRRFGVSIGVNFLPPSSKICSFHCVYCQYSSPDESDKEKSSFPGIGEFKQEFCTHFSHLKAAGVQPDWIMIAGNGEPTLHPHFHRAVEEVIRRRDEFFGNIPVGILSNSSTCHRREIRETLSLLDGRFMKLDAGSKEMFMQINRPCREDAWDQVMEGLCQMPQITLQSMFITGVLDNTHPDDVEDWVKCVEKICPESVQIYTVDRPTDEEGIEPVNRGRLEEIAERVEFKTGVSCSVYD